MSTVDEAAEVVEDVAEVIGRARSQRGAGLARGADGHEVLDRRECCEPGLRGGVVRGRGMGVVGPACGDRVVAQGQDRAGGVPGVQGEGVAVPRVRGRGHECPVLRGALGTADVRAREAQPGAEQVEEGG